MPWGPRGHTIKAKAQTRRALVPLNYTPNTRLRWFLFLQHFVHSSSLLKVFPSSLNCFSLCSIWHLSASLVVVQDPAHVLLSRQVPGTTPPQCNAACQTIFNITGVSIYVLYLYHLFHRIVRIFCGLPN